MKQKKSRGLKKKLVKRAKPKVRSFAPPRVDLKAFTETDDDKVVVYVEAKPYREKEQPTDQNYIRAWRLYRGVTMQKDLAELTRAIDDYGVGLDRVTISRLETGHMQYNETHLKLISHALRVAPRDLIGTNPFDSGDIFKQYADLPRALRRKVTLSSKT